MRTTSWPWQYRLFSWVWSGSSGRKYRYHYWKYESSNWPRTLETHNCFRWCCNNGCLFIRVIISGSRRFSWYYLSRDTVFHANTCQVQVLSLGEAYDALAIFDFIRKKYQIASICNIWHIPKEIIAHCFQQIDASYNIYYSSSSMRIMNVLGDFGYGQNKQGPSQVMGGNDHVPGLLCSKPFKAMDNFRRRQRESWPKEDTLSKIIRLPGVLVPTGNKGSLYRDIEWRESYSLPEFMLSQDMPAWVKIAHRAVKYTLKSQQRNIDQGDICTRSKFSIKNPLLWIVEKIANYLFNHFLLLDYELPYAELEGRSMISSYHIKTILMWELEINYRSHRQNSCPFQLMRNMLQRLDTCLNEGKIPNYFNPDCNLLENVAMEHIISTKNNINRILQDPLKSLVLCPQNPEKVYGHVKPDELLCNLKELFMDTTKNNFHQRADYMQSTLHALDKFRYSKYKTLCRLDDIPHESAALVSMLDLFREKCKAMCRLAIVPSEKMATNHLVDTFWGQIDKDLCRWSIIQQEAMLSSVDRCDIICLDNMFIQLMKNVWQALANTMTC